MKNHDIKLHWCSALSILAAVVTEDADRLNSEQTRQDESSLI